MSQSPMAKVVTESNWTNQEFRERFVDLHGKPIRSQGTSGYQPSPLKEAQVPGSSPPNREENGDHGEGQLIGKENKKAQDEQGKPPLRVKWKGQDTKKENSHEDSSSPEGSGTPDQGPASHISEGPGSHLSTSDSGAGNIEIDRPEASGTQDQEPNSQLSDSDLGPSSNTDQDVGPENLTSDRTPAPPRMQIPGLQTIEETSEEENGGLSSASNGNGDDVGANGNGGSGSPTPLLGQANPPIFRCGCLRTLFRCSFLGRWWS